MAKVPAAQLEAFKSLEEQEVSFLRTCGWVKSSAGWIHKTHSSRAAVSQSQAVSCMKRLIVKNQLLGRKP